MSQKNRPGMTKDEQSARFKETARKLGTDERPEEFDKVLTKIARVKPKGQQKSGRE
jgi:hypothetical protein